MKHFFFHFGPGGHPKLEESWFSERNSNLIFHDLSKLDSSPLNFEAMVWHYENFIDSEVPKPVVGVGHSFGCDVLWKLALKRPDMFSQIKLFAPIVDLRKSFVLLLGSVAELVNDEDFQNEVEQLSRSFSLDLLWETLGKAFSFPEFFRLFWGSQQDFDKWVQLQGQLPAMDLLYWKEFLTDYLINDLTPYSEIPNISTTVLLGTKDPYIDERDLEFWENRIGPANVLKLENTGHYPHLERKLLNL